MAQQQIEAVIAFADVSRSTTLYEKLGDLKARTAIAQCIAIMTEATQKHRGVVIKTIGDEVMAAFRTADDAADALALMQEEITDKMSVEGFPLAIRAGFHMGMMLLENGDVFGDAVNIAARVAGQAKAGQIMTTGATVDRLSPAWREASRQVDETTVRGKRDSIALFDLVRKREEATRMISTAQFIRSLDVDRLVVRCGSVEAVVGIDQPGVTLGRADGNDIIVREECVSRLHAKIEHRRGRFVLVDQSVNGTFVSAPDAGRTWVRRDEHILTGHGVIGLGREVGTGEGDAAAVTYRVE
jgi:adenylate cyclase